VRVEAEGTPGALAVRSPGVGLEIRVGADRTRWALARHLPRLDAAGSDLLTIAAAAYALDRAVPRLSQPDGWRREFELSVDVSDSDRWAPAAEQLAAALRFLTCDIWELSFRRGHGNPFVWHHSIRRDVVPDPEAVHLFSGGLDSLVGVVTALGRRPAGCRLLVGHQDQSGPESAQKRLHCALDSARFAGHTRRLTLRVAPRAAWSAREPSARSRSLLFIALGIAVARGWGAKVPVVVAENGFMALNIPLTLTRLGACSTRTTHPHFLSVLDVVLATAEISNPVSNPLVGMTKGEVIALAAAEWPDAMAAAVRESVSCAHASRRANWLRRNARNCGYCYPCLVRRASLHAVGLDEPGDYGIDACGGELDLGAATASDLRALLECLRTVTTEQRASDRLAMAGPLPAPRAQYIHVVQRGLVEIRRWISDRGTPAVRQLAGPLR